MGRARATGEPRWTAEDTALAVEWQRLKDEVCGGCGQPLTESLDQASEYEAHPIVCFGCLAKEQKERSDSQADNVDTAGRKIAITYVGRSPETPQLTSRT